ncbi:hypothetical protein E4T56_gene2995 [Termitomyces sp. T112]|nr:hypothetical protein E4T56_gene2995 [Termitomyces sp. T112]
MRLNPKRKNEGSAKTRYSAFKVFFDSNGSFFLLIEAAETLLSWAKPTNSENRVIYSSRIHLILIFTHISTLQKAS